jgi:hypothetical protein
MTGEYEAIASLAVRLRALRRDRYGDYGIPALAEELGIPALTWAHYEAGVVIPGTILLQFLAITGARPEWLLTGTGRRYRCTMVPGGIRINSEAGLN